MNLDEYLKKHGTKTLSVLVGRFIEKSPEFEGDLELAMELGKITADLELALENQRNSSKRQTKNIFGLSSGGTYEFGDGWQGR